MAINRNLITVLGLLVTLTLVNYIVTVAGQGLPTSGLFPFGDSYYDVGNKKYLSSAFLPSTTWPYGKSTDRPNGRYSDGKIVPDFIATFCGIPQAIPPALDPNGDFSRGASFAVGDATVLGDLTETLNLAQQVKKFQEMRSKYWNDTFLSESIFLFQIGTDDYLNFTKTYPDADASKQQAFVTSVVNQIRNELITLYNSGARKFAYPTLAPLGCFPIVKQEHSLDGDDCYEKLNDLAKQHNEKIRPMLEALAKMYPAFQYTVLDFYGAIERRLLSVDETTLFNNYRFSHTTVSCCGIGTHNAFGCGYINVHSKLCEYPREYLFFDGHHNTQKANEEVAHLLFSANPDIVGPMTLRELLVLPPDMSMLEF